MSEFESGLVPVLDMHKFDEAKLQAYLADKLPEAMDGITVMQFQGGQSNPTFCLSIGSNRYVLRKKPPRKLLPSAHMIEREFRVMSALADSKIPVPKMHLLCEDPSIIGTPFYIMDHISGRVIEMPHLPDVPKEDRTSIYSEMALTLANLHSIDVNAAGLKDYGKPENYYSRQISRWSKQYNASCEQPAGGQEGAHAMQYLISWLPENIPDDNAVAIAHGDYRIGNLMLAPDEPTVTAVLDWELSTLGHPLADLAYCCVPYHIQYGQDGIKGLKGLDLEKLGIPSESAFVKLYCEQSNRKEIAHWEFYLAFAMFRLAAILQGVYARALQGNASSANALKVGARAGILAITAQNLINS